MENSFNQKRKILI